MHSRGASPAVILLAILVGTSAAPALAAGPPVVIEATAGVDGATARRVRDVVQSRRSIRDDLALPPADTTSTEQVAAKERAASIRLALGRAQAQEGEAAWDGCVREAAGALSDAVEVLAQASDLALLRELHVQIGVCSILNRSEANARPHFLAAALLDESPIKTGLHREEAERAQEEARAEVLGRSRGKVRIETVPPGAEVWIDGRKAAGTTPLEVEVRLGEHFLTTRRFRFEAHTGLTLFQPSGVVRLALDPAQRPALREQLAAVAAAAIPRPPEAELRLARAVWSRAEQVVLVTPAGSERAQVALVDAASGQVQRTATVSRADSDAALRKAVCDALGETCEVKPRGVPWYVWPISGAAVVSGVIAAAVVVNNNRDYALCPASGCR